MPNDALKKGKEAAPAPMTDLDAVLLAIVRYGLFGVFVLPFIVVQQHLYPWVSGKIWGFEILVAILFPLWALLACRRREFRPSKNAFLIALLVYFGVETLAMLLGQNADRSMWSKPDRLTGMFFQYHLLAFFLMAGSVWRGIVERVIGAAVTVASILSLHALQQVVSGSTPDGRGSATLGNPSYLGQYLVPHLFLALLMLRRRLGDGRRLVWMAAVLVILAGIVSTKSKGALVGVFAGALVAVLIGAFRGEARLKKASRLGLALLALVVVGYFVGQKIRPINVWLYNQRISLQYLDETAGSRKLLLKNAVKGISQHPLLGWGPENFEDGFYFNYDPVTLRYSEYETRQDRPHNLILEILHNLGVVGFASYAAVFVCAGLLTLRRRGGGAVGGALLFIAAVSQVATDLFIFETPMSYLALFTMLALIQASIAAPEEQGPDETTPAGVPVALVLAVMSIWILARIQTGTIAGAKTTAEIIMGLTSEMEAGRFAVLIEDLRARHTPLQERYQRAIASHLSQPRGQYLDGPYVGHLARVAADEYAWMQRNRTDFVHALVSSAAHMSLWPRTQEQQAALEDSVAIAAERSPNRHEVVLMQMQIALEKGEIDAAEALAERVLSLDPGNVFGLASYARFLLEYRDPVRAAEAIAPSWKELHAATEAWDQLELGTLRLLNQRRHEDLGRLFDAAERLGTRNLQWDMTGMIAAFAAGDETKAARIAEEARERYPDQRSIVDQVVASKAEFIAAP